MTFTYDPARGYPVIVPCLVYEDPVAVAEWLTAVLGVTETVRAQLPDGWIGHLELAKDGCVLILGRLGGQFDTVTAGLTQVFVDDLDEACARAAEGGRILDPPGLRPWGVRQAIAADPEGQRWALTEYVADTDPATWYGRVEGGEKSSERRVDSGQGRSTRV